MISQDQDIFGKSIEDYVFVQDAKLNKNIKLYDAASRLHEKGVKEFHKLRSLILNGKFYDYSGRKITDAADGGIAFLTNNLSIMILPIQEVLFRTFDFTQFVPIRSNVPVRAGFYERLIIEQFGVSKRLDLTGNNADNSAISVDRRFAKIYTSGINGEWTDEEMRLAVNLSQPLSTLKIEAGLAADMFKLRRQALVGIANEPDDVTQLSEGLLNFAGITTTAATGLWSTLTTDEIKEDVQTAVSTLVSESEEITTTNPMFATMLTAYLPPVNFDRLAVTKDGTLRDKTLMQTLSTDNAWTQRLASVGSGGAKDVNTIPASQQLQFRSVLELDANVAATGRMVLTFNNINVCELAVPQMPTTGTPVRGLRKTTVPIDMIHGTFQFSQEKMALYIDGIGLS